MKNVKCNACGHQSFNHNPQNMKGVCAGDGCHCGISREYLESLVYPNSYDEKLPESAKYEHIEGVPMPVNIDLASTHQSCDKCYKFYEKHKLECPFCGHGWDEPVQPDTSLSLLVVDFNEYCVVRIEKGETKLFGMTKYERKVLVNLPFDVVKKEIDGQNKAPVPRLEPYPNGAYKLVSTGSDSDLDAFVIWGTHYDALSKLAGVTIPIYTPSEHQGTWTQLFPLVNCATLAQEKQAVQGQMDALPITVYRYTRN